ncbi:arginine-tRNA-protein transferase [Flagelloscypha sp. PMI_526]|nr:arginine-tRNA-protein transferase [Flagelloscypha sp. PMI_526]
MSKGLSIGTPSGLSASSCGYCGSPGQRSAGATSHHTAGLLANKLTCDVYQKMIDRGWRRSGTWCYRPHLETSCCPNYTIRLDASKFRTSKSQRKLINRFNRFILTGSKTGEGQKPMKARASEPTLAETIHLPEASFVSPNTPKHNFQVTLEPSSYTAEKYALFEKYQTTIHSDSTTPSGFKRFLVDTPLIREAIPYPTPPLEHLPKEYGSYHQLYRIDGVLVAMAVLDILPSCVSSVYFMYDKEWEEFSFGKISALRECSLAQELNNAGISELHYVYLGFYIHSCQKMKYKADYGPSFLLDHQDYEWYPLEQFRSLLDSHRYVDFSDPTKSLQGASPISPGQPDVSLDEDWLNKIMVISEIKDNTIYIIPAPLCKEWKEEYQRSSILWCAWALGRELTKDMIFNL